MKVRIRKPPADAPLPMKKPDAKCNGRKRSGGYCRQPAGWRTDHPGQGRCRKHGGNTVKGTITHGWYSNITHTRVKDILSGLAKIEADAMDLLPEVHLLRAMTVDYINRYDEFQEALMAWYTDPDSNSRPRRIMDIQDASHLIESISRVAQRLHQIQSEGSISLETFKRVTEQMGMVVARHVLDPVTLNAIEHEWTLLALDSKKPTSTSDSGDR